MVDSFVASNFYTLPLQIGRIDRAPLIARLENGLRASRLTLVSAVTGAGKTTLLAQWAALRQSRVAWLSLDDEHNDPARFLNTLLSALQTVDSSLGRQSAQILHALQGAPLLPALTVLLNEIAELHEQIILVLDDYHLLTAPPVHELVTFMVDHLPAQLHLVLSTRADPPLPLGRSRARGQLTEIRTAQLRFSDDEAAQLFDHSLPPETIHALVTRLDGWAAGLQLAALVLRDHADPSAFLADFLASTQPPFDYLIQAMFRQQPDSARQFLLQTSLLRRVCPPLCDAVLERDDSAALLDGLRDTHLFLIPLVNGWYRYHPLVEEMLRPHQRTQPPPVEFYSRASAWYEQAGMLEEAVSAALHIPDIERAANLIERAGRALIFSGQLTTLQRWLGALTDDLIRERPCLRLYRGWIEYVSERVESAAYELQDARRVLALDQPEEAALFGEISIMLASIAALRGETPNALIFSAEALRYLPEQDPFARARAVTAHSYALMLSGDLDGALQSGQSAIALANSGGSGLIPAQIRAAIASGLVQVGRLHAAENYFREIVNGQVNGSAAFFSAMGAVGLAQIAAERDQLEEATALVNTASTLSERGGLLNVTYQANRVRMRLYHAAGEFDRVLDLLYQTSQRFYGRYSPLLDVDLAAQAVQMALWRDDFNEAERWYREISRRRLPAMLDELTQLSLARLELAAGNPELAFDIARDLYPRVSADKRLSRMIDVHILQALALDALEAEPPALRALEQALTLGMEEGYARVFLDEGQVMLNLLARLLDQPTLSPAIHAYAARLLASD